MAFSGEGSNIPTDHLTVDVGQHSNRTWVSLEAASHPIEIEIGKSLFPLGGEVHRLNRAVQYMRLSDDQLLISRTELKSYKLRKLYIPSAGTQGTCKVPDNSDSILELDEGKLLILSKNGVLLSQDLITVLASSECLSLLFNGRLQNLDSSEKVILAVKANDASALYRATLKGDRLQFAIHLKIAEQFPEISSGYDIQNAQLEILSVQQLDLTFVTLLLINNENGSRYCLLKWQVLISVTRYFNYGAVHQMVVNFQQFLSLLSQALERLRFTPI